VRRKPSTNQPSELDFGEPPRRQQVIGGNLSGVNRKKTFGIFSRYGNISLAYWGAAVIVLLIVIAFFWPQKQNAITEVTKQLETNRVVALDDEILEQPAAGTAGFSRNSDLTRAEEYRQQDIIDNQVKALLDEAARYIEQRQFTQPRDANAVLAYQRALELRPSNPQALDGLDKIKQHFLFRGFNALEGEKPALAKSNLERLGLISKSSSEYEELAAAIAQYTTNQEIDTLLDKAKQAFDEQKYVLPARESALAYYEQVLAQRAEDAAATEGIKQVADALVEQANNSVLNGDLNAASAQLATVGVIDPDHKSIALIEAMIASAKPLAETKPLEEAEPLQETDQKNTVEDALEITQNSELEPPSTTPEVLNEGDDTASTDSQTVPGEVSLRAFNNAKTSNKLAEEQAVFDKQYLQEGLNAYYSGDYDTALTLLQPLADKGIARAQMRLAYMHFLGRGFQRDRDEAEQIVRSALPAIRKFANEGRGWAQSDLGSLYEDGLVLPRNFSEAVYWYRTAAEKGFPGAQTSLGTMYARGRGVAPSRRTAIEWYQRASKQGDKLARRNLESMGVNPRGS